MTNTELMRTFFPTLPEHLVKHGKGWTVKWFDGLTDAEVIDFIDGLHMDYPTAELQEQFEQNKAMWKMAIQFSGKGGKVMFL